MRFRIAIANAVCVSLLFVVTGCGGEGAPTDGSLKDGEYRNTYFGFTMPIPDGWAVAPAEALEAVEDMGESIMDNGDTLRSNAIKAAKKNTYRLLMVSEHPIGAPVEYNSSLVLMAEKVSHLPGIQSGEDYLYQARKAIIGSGLPYEQVGEPESIQISGRDFAVTRFVLNAANLSVVQSYYASLSNGYALSFITTAIPASKAGDLDGVVESVEFD